jgi:hypothetical protein
MTGRQQFTGDFSSQLHRLNGNNFYGPVSIATPDPKERGILTALQGEHRRKLAGRDEDEVDERLEIRLKEDLSWDGESVT